MAVNLRRTARDERILLHYNGHGCPRPTSNGEIWVFNKNFTQYEASTPSLPPPTRQEPQVMFPIGVPEHIYHTAPYITHAQKRQGGLNLLRIATPCHPNGGS